MKIDLPTKVKYQIRYTGDFKKNYKKIKRQGKDVEKLKVVISNLANGLELEEKYRNHMLTNSKHYKNCGECHIESDWLLVYRYINNELVLVFIDTGSHSELF